MNGIRRADLGTMTAGEITKAREDGRLDHLLSGTARADGPPDDSSSPARPSGFQGSGDGGARSGSSRPRQVTAAALKTMTPAQINKARKDGRLQSLLEGQ